MRLSLEVGKFKFCVLGGLAKLSYDGKNLFLKCGHKFLLTNRDS